MLRGGNRGGLEGELEWVESIDCPGRLVGGCSRRGVAGKDLAAAIP